ncbi:hypothetical protein [Actinomadura rubrisoli]|uniref:Uncharacterized protein n=1 Tax=Actinomadura rubrisoli TaxID=2530368 RepID=A0A4R5CBG2_9ACTN|nr:hypothetical protein [Actinomadura rubrisoli]TDD96725.1 hypothetical protein E1298_02875 [Actinomadura rubrisoli]
MDHSASLTAPARRMRRIVLVSLAALVAAIDAFIVQWPFAASAPQSSLTTVGQSAGRKTALDEGDGVIPAGTAVSVFDEEAPAVGKLALHLRGAATDAEAHGCPPMYADPRMRA